MKRKFSSTKFAIGSKRTTKFAIRGKIYWIPVARQISIGFQQLEISTGFQQLDKSLLDSSSSKSLLDSSS